MATLKRTAQKVRTVSTGDATINIADENKTSETVTVLFRSRQSLKADLGRKTLTLAGNAVYLASAKGGALPAGGYGVTVVDKDDWEEFKRRYGKTFAPWFRSGRLKVEEKETKGVNYALDHAGDKTGDDPIQKKEAK